jgi:hypothetical protein
MSTQLGVVQRNTRGRASPADRLVAWLSDKATPSSTFVRLASSRDFGMNHFDRGGPALAA